MPFKPKTFKESYKKVTGREYDGMLFKDLNVFESLGTPGQKAGFIKILMEELTKQVPKADANRIMQECGTSCIGESTIRKAKKLYKESSGMTEFLSKLNDNHIGGGLLQLDGNIISGGYDTCYCGSVSKTKEVMPITYCYCSTGWYKRLFEEVLEKAVEVEILETIASGADKCEFRIKI
jgi:predicted hydrocarbon binding protein